LKKIKKRIGFVYYGIASVSRYTIIHKTAPPEKCAVLVYFSSALADEKIFFGKLDDVIPLHWRGRGGFLFFVCGKWYFCM